MIPKEREHKDSSGLPLISRKISSERLKEFSGKRWLSDDLRAVSQAIVRNGEELLAGDETNWDLVLGSIRSQRQDSVQFGEAAIAASGASFIGALGAQAQWSMHDPQMVYLSGVLLGYRVNAKDNGELEGFKNRMQQACVDYGQKVLPKPSIYYMEILDFLLLEITDRRTHRSTMDKVVSLLKEGNIKKAYNLINSLDDRVRKRGQGSSKTTTSSILTPPNPGK